MNKRMNHNDAYSEEGPECRICLASDSDARGDVFISPCACSGSNAYVHVSCLIKCVKYDMRGKTTCSACRQAYLGISDSDVREEDDETRELVYYDNIFNMLVYFIMAYWVMLVGLDLVYRMLEKSPVITNDDPYMFDTCVLASVLAFNGILCLFPLLLRVLAPDISSAAKQRMAAMGRYIFSMVLLFVCILALLFYGVITSKGSFALAGFVAAGEVLACLLYRLQNKNYNPLL